MTEHIDSKVDFHQHNEAFLRLKIPYLCLAESEKTFFPVVGKKYYYVPPDYALLESHKTQNNHIIEGKTHGTVQQAKDD